MPLKEQLKALQVRLESGRSHDVVAAMHRAVEEFRASGAADRVLKVGDKAPDFVLPNAAEQPIDSRALLVNGPLVVSFYRGRW
jgi:hypothetical protein